MIASVLHDLRYAWRALWARPGPTAAAVLILALGIGATTALFAVADAVLWRPLPFEDPGRLVSIWETNLRRGRERNPVSVANFFDWKERSRSVSDLAAFSVYNVTLSGGEEPLLLPGGSVTEGFFPVLSARPHLGRLFDAGDFRPDAEPVAVVSHAFWQNRLGARPGALGSDLELNGRKRTVVGILPRDFRFSPRDADVWLPWIFSPEDRANRRSHYLQVIARLRPGVGIESARSEMDAIADRLREEHPEWMTGFGVRVLSLHEETVRGVRPALLVLFGAVGLVWLATCFNVANLWLTRVAQREREIAIRASLGAGRMRLLRELLMESLVLACLGAAAGLVAAYAGLEVFLASIPFELPRIDEVDLGRRVLGFTLAAALLTGVGVGLSSALRASHPRLDECLREGGRGAGQGMRSTRFRSALVVAEVAVSVVLLVGAGLLLRSFWRVLQVDPGFAPDRALAVSLQLPGARYPENRDHIAFYRELIGRARSLPGVLSAGGISDLPLDGLDATRSFIVEGRPLPGPGERIDLSYRTVLPGYFRTVGIPLLEGRTFTERDDESAPRGLVINQTMARLIWPGERPLGQRISFDGPEGPWHEIVGIVGDTHDFGLDEPAPGAMYAPHAQKTWPWMSQMTLVLRTREDPNALAVPVREVLRAMDPDLPGMKSRTLEQQLAGSVADRRFQAMLLGLFAGTALILASLGVYAVTAFSVTERRHELGIRMALGANRTEILKSVSSRGAQRILMGVSLGWAGALALSRLLESLLFQVSATDSATFAGASLLLLLVSAVANLVPALRATKLDPAVVLRKS